MDRRSQDESQDDWEGLLGDLYRRGLEGKQVGLIVTDGCLGLAAAIPTVYPRVRHQRCWAHKMRNILKKLRKAGSGRAGTGSMERWCGNWNATCQSCCRSSPSPGTGDASCVPPT
ncbi:MAG TPA: transposase [Terriglobales bacterium]